MSRSWHDLYEKGEKLSWLAKSAMTKYQSAIDRDDEIMAQAWLESARKTLNSAIAVACIVLKVEDVIKGKNRSVEA